MPRTAMKRAAWAVALAAAGMIGCQSVGLRFLSLFGFQKNPLVVALVAESQPVGTAKPFQGLNPFAAYEPWRRVLSDEMNQPVGLDLCLPLQLEPCLAAGMFDAAIVPAGQYARLATPQRFPVLAIPTDPAGRAARAALLVVPPDSPIQTVEDLRGKTVAFGPAGDARTHLAALRLLADHGLRKTDLALQALPLPGSLKHMPDMRSVAQTVINASSDAGFVDEAAYEAWPEHDDRPNEPARDRLRIVARTAAVPDRLILASPKLDTAARVRFREALLAVDGSHPDALGPLNISGYVPPSDELLASCTSLANLEPSASENGTSP